MDKLISISQPSEAHKGCRCSGALIPLNPQAREQEGFRESGGERGEQESVPGVISWPIKQTLVSHPHVMREADTQGLVSQHMNHGKGYFYLCDNDDDADIISKIVILLGYKGS